MLQCFSLEVPHGATQHSQHDQCQQPDSPPPTARPQVPAEVMQFDVHTYLTSLKYEVARNIDKHVIYLPPGFVMPRRRLGEQPAGQAGEEEHEQPQVEKLY